MPRNLSSPATRNPPPDRKRPIARQQRCDKCTLPTQQLLDARDLTENRAIRWVCPWCFELLGIEAKNEGGQLAWDV